MTVCQVCNVTASKYKCPTCQTPYCSITCYKEHKPIHATSTSSPAPLKTDATESPPPAPKSLPTQDPSKSQPNSFPHSSTQKLLESPLYQSLLVRYPALRSDLSKIYRASLPPAEIAGSDESAERDSKRMRRGARSGGRGAGRSRGSRSGRGRGSGEGPRWNPEKGRKRMGKPYEEMREMNEGFREFVKVCEATAKADGRGDDAPLPA